MRYLFLSVFICGCLSAQVETVKVVSKRLEQNTRLPGELQPYLAATLSAKITGFVDSVAVDRGSAVKEGQLLVQLSAPEYISQRAAAEARLQSALAAVTEAEARAVADESTSKRLKAAAATPGVISGQELEVAQKAAESSRARVQSLRDAAEAARASLRALREMESYLQVKAPFDGVVTERNVHPGALAGPSAAPLLRLEQISRLRLVVAVPEAYFSGVARGAKISFTVPAYPGESFDGILARVAHSLDVRTRSMPVELDVANPSGRLAPGMFGEVLWPQRRPGPSLFLPNSAVARTQERVFVVRVAKEKAEWVNVKTGVQSGNLIEVFGDLKEGDEVVLRATDELKPGTAVARKR